MMTWTGYEKVMGEINPEWAGMTREEKRDWLKAGMNYGPLRQKILHTRGCGRLGWTKFLLSLDLREITLVTDVLKDK
jgi:hypothetical protein